MPRFAISLFSLLFFLAACDSTDPWDPGIPDIPRTDVFLANFSAEPVLEVYLRPVQNTEWGSNWLTEPVGGGALYAFVGQVISGHFDVRMVGAVQTQEVLDLNIIGESIGVSFHAVPALASP